MLENVNVTAKCIRGVPTDFRSSGDPLIGNRRNSMEIELKTEDPKVDVLINHSNENADRE